jgi:hypothetical protein
VRRNSVANAIIMRNRFFLAALLLSSFSFSCSRGGPETTPLVLSIDGLNASCAANEPCNDGLSCGGPGESEGQCVVACPSPGPGPSHGCPEGAFCYVFDKDEGHYCTRTCTDDADCKAVNAALVCKSHGGEDFEEIKRCNLP